ncbi:hypothetical protein K1719_044236 [Acacia pycnantha]|nr:hypothetical protein K1719_044236 [Acacia pycnantha]
MAPRDEVYDELQKHLEFIDKAINAKSKEIPLPSNFNPEINDKGSHGDGHPSNIGTPLVASVKHLRPISSSNHIDYGFRFADEQVHGTPTPAGWGLLELERIDVKQADVAPHMLTLLGQRVLLILGSLPSIISI